MGVRWLKIKKNKELFEKTDAESIIVKRRRLSWLHHLLRLDE